MPVAPGVREPTLVVVRPGGVVVREPPVVVVVVRPVVVVVPGRPGMVPEWPAAPLGLAAAGGLAGAEGLEGFFCAKAGLRHPATRAAMASGRRNFVG